MSVTRSWHVYRCDADGCGVEKRWEHGEFAEAEIPPRWFQARGFSLHACSAAHRDLINAHHQAKTGKRYIFIEWKRRAA
jgi:hypothetical protein